VWARAETARSSCATRICSATRSVAFIIGAPIKRHDYDTQSTLMSLIGTAHSTLADRSRQRALLARWAQGGVNDAQKNAHVVPPIVFLSTLMLTDIHARVNLAYVSPGDLF
jgi:hypothetical protein